MNLLTDIKQSMTECLEGAQHCEEMLDVCAQWVQMSAEDIDGWIVLYDQIDGQATEYMRIWSDYHKWLLGDRYNLIK